VAKVIKKSDGAGFFAKGGSGHMFGPGCADPAPAGVSVKDSQGSGGGKFEYAHAGKSHMFGKGYANQAPAGVSVKNSQ
jgi:hypothetical protein